MQGLAPKRVERRLGLRPEVNGLGLEVRSVDGIAEQGMTGMAEMDPDLVRAPGLQPEREQGRYSLAIAPGKSFAEPPMRDRFAAAGAYRHFLPRVRVAVDRRNDGAVRTIGHAPGEGEIAALHRAGAAMIGELRRQRAMREVVL